jgi:hypothetical protein
LAPELSNDLQGKARRLPRILAAIAALIAGGYRAILIK